MPNRANAACHTKRLASSLPIRKKREPKVQKAVVPITITINATATHARTRNIPPANDAFLKSVHGNGNGQRGRFVSKETVEGNQTLTPTPKGPCIARAAVESYWTLANEDIRHKT